MKPNPNPNSREPRDPRDPTAQQPLVSSPSKKVTLQPKAQGDEVNKFSSICEQQKKHIAGRRLTKSNDTAISIPILFSEQSFQLFSEWFFFLIRLN